ncbi:hypothetical protein KLP28_04785 [Nocardioidaceae bacterium]|nr:hypothetical protein KLP28_04785 [Nocardioidaceae bacterium]
MATALLELVEPDLDSSSRLSQPPTHRRARPPRDRRPLLVVAVAQRAGTTWTTRVAVPAGEMTALVRRLTGKVELLLDEVLALLGEIRPLVPAVVAAVEQGLLEEVTGLVREARPLVPKIGDALDRGLLDDLDATLARLETLPRTQDDVRLIVETLQTLVGLTTITLDQLESIPGAGLVRRRITKALADAQVAPAREA